MASIFINEFPKVLNIARKIAGIEEISQKVVAATNSTFFVDDAGVWFYPSIESEREWISSPIQIDAMTRDENSKSWGRLLSFKDQDGIEKTWSMPMDLLAGDGIEVRRQLLNLGLQLALGKKERNLLLSYLQSTKPNRRIQCVERMGWYSGNFVLPKETIKKDEQGQAIGEIQPKDAGLAAYVLGSGQSKSRATKNRSLVDLDEWRLLFLSSGEIGLASHINSDGGQTKAGQEIRLIDIPADPEKGFGIFENIHDYAVSNEFAIQLSQNVEKFFGTPIIEFLKAFIKSREVFSTILNKRQHFLESLELSDKHSQIYRVAQRFSLLAAAGELAIEFGILPWNPGEVERACLRCFKDWEAQWGCKGNKEGQQIIQQIRRLIQEFGPARFPLLEEQRRVPTAHLGVLWGFRIKNSENEIEWLILNEVFRNEFCRGFEQRNVIKSLKEADVIKTTLNGETSFPFRLPHLGLTRVVKLKSNLIQ